MSFFYYALYKFILLTPSKNEQPEHIANIILALILQFTLFGLLNVLKYFDVNLGFNIWENRILIIGIYLFFLIFGYFRFVRNKRYVTLKKYFDSQSRGRKVVNFYMIFSYLITLIFLNFCVN